MALNVKAAMMICAACIGGMSWLMRGVDVRQVEVPSPLVAGEPVRPRLVADVPQASPLPGLSKDRRSDLARQFEHRSPVEAVAADDRSAGEALAVIAPADPLARKLPPMLLPPRPRADLDVPTVRLAAQEAPLSDVAAARTVPEVSPEPTVVALHQAPPTPAEPEFREYQVVRGDNLWRIARRAYGSQDPKYVALLKEANPKVRARNGQVNLGERIQVPTEATAERMLAALVAAAAPAAETDDVRWYTIQRNDSLIRIARRHLKDATRWREIVKLNRSLNPDRIYPGMKIKLPPVMRMVRS